MRFAFRRWAAVAVLALSASGCARGPRRSSAAGDRNTITRTQIAEHHFNTAYEAVEALRSNWLLTRGTDSFSSPSAVQVYMDLTRLGGVDQLRSIAVTNIAYIRYFDGVTATARWGLDHGAGAILVSTQP